LVFSGSEKPELPEMAKNAGSFFSVTAMLKKLLTPSMFHLIFNSSFPYVTVSFAASIHFRRRYFPADADCLIGGL